MNLEYLIYSSTVKIQRIWGVGNINNLTAFYAINVGLTEFQMDTLPANLNTLYLGGNHLSHTNQVQILQAFDSHGLFAAASPAPILDLGGQLSPGDPPAVIPLNPTSDACVVQSLLTKNLTVFSSWGVAGEAVSQLDALDYCTN